MRETGEVEQDPDMIGPTRRGARRGPQAWLPAAVAVVLATLQPVPATAEERADFTFRRVKPPEPGQRRITVQIDPAEQKRLLAASPAVPPRPAVPFPAAPATDATPGAGPASRYAWFWDLVPPGLGAVDGRFARALAALSSGPGGARVGAPRLQQMQEIAARYGADILRATIGTEVSPALVLAVIGIESAGQPEAVSRAGAMGLMQLMPATAERFGVGDRKDPVENIRGGVAYLDWLMRHFDRDPVMVLAAYNAGEGAVRTNGGVPPYAETRDYVPKVLAAWQVAQGLCATPPELVTDPCVFRVMQSRAEAGVRR